MDGDSSDTQDAEHPKPLYHRCIAVYPLLIRRIVSHCDLDRLLNEYIFSDVLQIHEKYMVTTSGQIENGQFVIYFANKVSAEAICEQIRFEPLFSCSLPKHVFMTEPNKDQFIPTSMRKWRWKPETKSGVAGDWLEYGFKNCYRVEHAIDNKHDSVVLAVSAASVQDENTNNSNQSKDRKHAKPGKSGKLRRRHSHTSIGNSSSSIINEWETAAPITEWHLLIFSESFLVQNKNNGLESSTHKEMQRIEIEPATFHQGLVTEIDAEKQKGFVHNKSWNVHHSFTLSANMALNQLISYTLLVPSSCVSTPKVITADDCVARNVTVISGTVLTRRTYKSSEFMKPINVCSPTHSSSSSSSSNARSPIVTPKRRQTAFNNVKPKRRHSIAASHHRYRCGGQLFEPHQASKSYHHPHHSRKRSGDEFGGGITIRNMDDVHHVLLANAENNHNHNHNHNHNCNQSVGHHKGSRSEMQTMFEFESFGATNIVPLNQRRRSLSREMNLSVSLPRKQANTPSPSHSVSFRSVAGPLTPLSEIGGASADFGDSKPLIGCLTPSGGVVPIPFAIHDNAKHASRMEESESREKQDKIRLFDMEAWSASEMREFLTTIGEKQLVRLFRDNDVTGRHLNQITEHMLCAYRIPLFRIRNLIDGRDHCRACDELLVRLEELDVKRATQSTLQQTLFEVKKLLWRARSGRKQATNQKCGQFTDKYNEVVQILKDYVERIETALDAIRKNTAASANTCHRKSRSEMEGDKATETGFEFSDIDVDEIENRLCDAAAAAQEDDSAAPAAEAEAAPAAGNEAAAETECEEKSNVPWVPRVQPQNEVIAGCNQCQLCVGCVVLQLMNMNYVGCNFGDNDCTDMVLLMIEKQLLQTVKNLVNKFSRLRVRIYFNAELFCYTLILSNVSVFVLCDFEDFIKHALGGIGFKIPLMWKRSTEQAQLWKQRGCSDMHCDYEVLQCYEKRMAEAEQAEREAFLKRSGISLALLQDPDMSRTMSGVREPSLSKSGSNSSAYMFRPSFTMRSPSKERITRSPSNSKSITFKQKPKQKQEKSRSPSKSKSKFKSLRKSLVKRMSLSKRKSKSKKKTFDHSQNESGNLKLVNELEELRGYGFDNDSMNVSDTNQIFFMAGAVFVSGTKVNLYQHYQSVQKKLNQTLRNRLQRYHEHSNNSDDVLLSDDKHASCSSQNLYFVETV